MDGFEWSHISHDQNMLLTSTPSLEEIQDAVFALDPDSSPGRNSFGGCFYQKCWSIIADDVAKAIIYLFASLNFPSGMNSSFVTLIPKVADSIRISDFRPIVMGNFIYKIFTKVVYTRLGSFIGDVLSSSQYGFVPGRSIHTCIALASETINNLHLGTKGNMAFKVDITKAFDIVSWEFLEYILSCMHFSKRFIEMVRNILQSTKLSILINGTPHGFFSCSRRVRQGDPLSSLLFCLAEEALIKWLEF